MNNFIGGDYTREQAEENLNVLRTVEDQVVGAVNNAASTDLLEFLIRDQKLDIHHEGDQGVGPIRRAVRKFCSEPARAGYDLGFRARS